MSGVPRGPALPRALLPTLLLALGLGACQPAPPYVRPDAPLAPAWRPEPPWREARPDDTASLASWWQAFADPTLDALVSRALRGSQTLAGALARLEQARRVVDLNRSGLAPTIQWVGTASRQRLSADRPVTNYGSRTSSTVQNDLRTGFNVSYEPDVFGRVRLQIQEAGAGLGLAEAGLRSAQLLITTDLVAHYVNLRALDVDMRILEEGITLQQRALRLVSDRHELGAASGLDVAQQETVLANTQTQLELQRRQRRTFETALATLVGEPAPLFALAPGGLPTIPPAPVPGLPSDLLERRPDIAAAERVVAASSARIGIARTAFFPSFPLTGTLGFEATSLARLIDASSLFWSLGVGVAQRVFDGGRTRAQIAISEADHEAAVAAYRQSVLVAMEEVENGLAAVSALTTAASSADRARDQAGRVLNLADDRYAGGLTNYLDVITAQQSLLNTQRQSAQIHAQRQLAAVYLVKALGGDPEPIGAPAAPTIGRPDQ